ncbi:MAG: xanthan lyase, partial [Prevotella sp.]|nr:xanthan lyase [Prevotella sp.]
MKLFTGRRAGITALTLLYILTTLPLHAQSARDELKMTDKLKQYFAKYKPKGVKIAQQPHMIGYTLDHDAKTLTIEADEWFAMQEFTPEVTENIYKKIKGELPRPYKNYTLTVKTLGMEINELIPNRLSGNADKSRLWGDIDYDGQPWVKQVSTPLKITHGLQGRHLSLWASHGRYYDLKNAVWKWQRPRLFGTTEDLFTQTIVVPYLIPMLENAGAVVFTPRERDWQKEEIIVDNDGDHHNYIEVTARDKWKTTYEPGFAFHTGAYSDGENPFTAGTARMVKTTSSKSRYSLATYQPTFRKAGRYAVYVSYQTLPQSIDQVEYTVWHKGERTVFHVNQQMGGGTWVYLGSFDFDAGYSEFNRVTVSNQSGQRGIVTTDAVRFGGGMG